MDGPSGKLRGSAGHGGVEHRLAREFRVAGRTLTGAAMVYGDTSPSFNERFEPGAFGEVRSIAVNLQHDPSLVVVRDALLTDTPRALRVRAELPPGSAALDLVRRGALNGFSIEFHAKAERREAGVRVVERADLTGLALVDRGAYPGATAEVRARSGRTLRQIIPSGRNLGCECSGAACKFARFTDAALSDMLESAFADVEAEILAVRGSYGTPIASKSRGGVRGRMRGEDAEVEIDIPTGPDGDAILRDIENTGAVVARPYLDASGSDGTIETLRAEDGGNVMVYQRARLRALVVGATDARSGWPEPELVRTPDDLMPEGRAEPAPAGKRRLWL